MLTGMTERDWLIALEEVFEPGHDDRKFLEAIHYFTVHSIVELRQLFPGIVDNAQARLCVRTHRWLAAVLAIVALAYMQRRQAGCYVV